MRLAAVAIVCIGAFALCACGEDASPTGSDPITVYAAASLRDAFEALAADYRQSHGVEMILSFGSSSALGEQISQGAPADVFVSADLENAQALVDAGLTDGGATTLATNWLAIVVPADGATVASWQDLARPGVRVVAAGQDVPITRYADELIDELASEPGAPPAFADAYAANVVSREDNVRAVLAKVELGEGDAAIVYRTDALSSDEVQTLAIPDAATVAAEYAFVTIDGATGSTAELAEWLLDDEAQAILADLGFGAPDR